MSQMSGRSHSGQRVVASLSMPTDVVVAAPQPAMMLCFGADAACASGSAKEPARIATLPSSAPQLASALAATEEANAFCAQYAYAKKSEVDRARSQLAAQTAAMLEQQRRYTQLNNVILGLDRERHAVQAETEAVYKEVAGLASSNRTLKVRVNVRCRAHNQVLQEALASRAAAEEELATVAKAADAAKEIAERMEATHRETQETVAATQARITQLNAERSGVVAGLPVLRADAAEAHRGAASLRSRQQVRGPGVLRRVNRLAVEQLLVCSAHCLLQLARAEPRAARHHSSAPRQSGPVTLSGS
jgi:hypothetical protein